MFPLELFILFAWFKNYFVYFRSDHGLIFGGITWGGFYNLHLVSLKNINLLSYYVGEYSWKILIFYFLISAQNNKIVKY